MGVLPAGMGWWDVPLDFLRQQLVDGGLRVVAGTSLWHQAPVAQPSLAQTEADIPGLPQHAPVGCSPVTRP